MTSQPNTSSASPAHPTDYTIHASPIHGKGMFAARAFQPGETIIRDPIAIEVDRYPGGFNGMSEDYPLDIWIACCAARPETTRRLTDLTASTDPYAIDWIEANFTSAPSPWRRGRPEDVVSKFINNSLGDAGRSWIALEVSRINHSCAPNAQAAREGDFEVVTALEGISEGEEVTISYVRGKRDPGERRKKLTGWGIQCGCDLCGTARVGVLKKYAVGPLPPFMGLRSRGGDAQKGVWASLREKIRSLVA